MTEEPSRRTPGRRSAEPVGVMSARRPAMHHAATATPVLSPRSQARNAREADGVRAVGRPRGPWAGVAAGLALAVGAFLLFQIAARPDRFATALVAAPILLAVVFPISRYLGRREAAFDLGSIIVAGTIARVGATLIRDANAADGAVYFSVGRQLSSAFRAMQFGVDTGREIPGTGFIRYLSGLVQVITLNDRFATFLVFTGFSVAGTIFFYLAFARGLPDGQRQRYAALVFLWPSLVYWPSSLGKEAWMLLCIGAASYGVARVLSGGVARGTLLAVVGVLGTSMVRPHVSMIVMAAAAVAVLIRKPAVTTKLVGGRRVIRTVGGGAKVVAIVLVLIGGGFLATQTQKVLKLDDSSTDSIGSGLEATEAQTSQGNSAFRPFTASNPANYPAAAVTVVFRPFPFEARGVESLLSASEGVLLLVLFLTSLPRLVHLPRLMRREAYVAYALALVLVFVYAFSAIGNFGILARQRTQVLPLVFVLVCLPVAAAARRGPATADAAEEDGDTESRPDSRPTRRTSVGPGDGR